MKISTQKSPLLAVLFCLTVLSIFLQLSLFFIHNHTSNLIDTLVSSSITSELLHLAILIPILKFILIQCLIYIIFTLWIWFITVSTGELFAFSPSITYWMGIFFWLTSCIGIIAFNNYYYPNSFFAEIFNSFPWITFDVNLLFFILPSTILLFATGIGYINFIFYRRHLICGSILLSLIILSLFAHGMSHFLPHKKLISQNSTPNIILIGLDSVRPDFIHFNRHRNTVTPNIDKFLATSTNFTRAYTPLARTFPAWISILTSQYPIHHSIRNNLANPSKITLQDNLAKELKKHDYYTIYATDEKRFSNITEAYGFDTVIGPAMGINDFLLGGLSDFPLSNILINSPLGKFLFPYHYANRAAAITYEPHSFLALINQSLHHSQQPVFLSIHLCVTHWPFTWAHDNQKNNFTLAQRYRSSVEEVDHQFGELISILKTNALLDHTIVVLLSDHGTTVGLPHERIIKQQNYIGDKKNLSWITRFKVEKQTANSDSTFAPLSIETSYGQGSDILSLKQYHVLLAFKGFGLPIQKQQIHSRVSLLDIAPTLLNYLDLPSLSLSDGISLATYLKKNHSQNNMRPLFLETGYTVSEMETNDIQINKVLTRALSAYTIDPKNGLIYMKSFLEPSIIQSKQRAVLLNDWLLAYYPASTRQILNVRDSNPQFKSITIPAYYVLVNIKTGKWTINLSNQFAKTAPQKILMQQFQQFYGNEIER